MSKSDKDTRMRAQALEENEELRLRLREAEETLEAIRHADVDALVVSGPRGEQVFSLTGAEHIYRVIVEAMNEAALTVDPDGTILFCNRRFCDLMRTPIQQVMGHKASLFVARPQQPPLKALLADAQAGPVQRRLTLRAADGAAVPVQTSASPLRTGDRTSICLVASDPGPAHTKFLFR
jgi:PAS domain S-box-containing protein